MAVIVPRVTIRRKDGLLGPARKNTLPPDSAGCVRRQRVPRRPFGGTAAKGRVRTAALAPARLRRPPRPTRPFAARSAWACPQLRHLRKESESRHAAGIGCSGGVRAKRAGAGSAGSFGAVFCIPELDSLQPVSILALRCRQGHYAVPAFLLARTLSGDPTCGYTAPKIFRGWRPLHLLKNVYCGGGGRRPPGLKATASVGYADGQEVAPGFPSQRRGKPVIGRR
jgi:hypothetical protein